MDKANSFTHEREIKYTQDWAAYDRAKTKEPILFKSILDELLRIYFKESRKFGKRILPKDRIFMMAMKVYHNSSLRKSKGMLDELYGGKAPSFRSICGFFNDIELEQYLDDLILITAMPLAALEQTAAIDATGFTISKTETWSNYKWGVRGRTVEKAKASNNIRVWRKAHAVACCHTNAFISVEVTDANVHDSKMVEKAISDKIKYFELEDFVADRAYSSKKILEFLKDLNLNPIIPFKKNVTGRARGSSIWKEMFRYFKDHPDEFYKRYHTRSNIETSFHMVKQKFGANLWTKTYEANVNEIKIKFLCHNICVLIQEIFENNISIDFEVCANRIGNVQID